VILVMQEGKPFNAEPRAGPGLGDQNDRAFAEAYGRWKAKSTKGSSQTLPHALRPRHGSGREPRTCSNSTSGRSSFPDAMASHATSAARYLEECLPGAEYWDVLPEDKQSEPLQRGCWSSWKK